MAAVPKAPFQWPAFTGPSSRIITQTPDKSNWQDAAILVPHETIRWWQREILEILAVYDPIDLPHTEWKTNVLFNFLENYYVVCVHHHHDAEENIYNPAIADYLKAKGKEDPFTKIKDDHAKLLQTLDNIGSYRSRIAKGDAEALAEFKTSMTDLANFMDDHFADEEIQYPKALRDSEMSREEEQAIVTEIIQGLGLDGNKKFTPAALYVMCMWLGEKGMQEFGQGIPPPIRLMLNQCWLDDFLQNQLNVLDALKKDEHFEPQAPSCGCSLM